MTQWKEFTKDCPGITIEMARQEADDQIEQNWLPMSEYEKRWLEVHCLSQGAEKIAQWRVHYEYLKMMSYVGYIDEYLKANLVDVRG
jgi:hypothetical protein